MNPTDSTMLVLDESHVSVSAGRYFLGDPCYPFPNSGPDQSRWSELLKSCDYFEDTPVGSVTVQGQTFAVVAFSTFEGGGMGSDGFEYGVDAGLIGLVPLALVDALDGAPSMEWLRGCGTIIDASEGFVAHTDGSTLTFGSVVIKTTDEAEADTDCHICGYSMPYGYCERPSCAEHDGDEDSDG